MHFTNTQIFIEGAKCYSKNIFLLILSPVMFCLKFFLPICCCNQVRIAIILPACWVLLWLVLGESLCIYYFKLWMDKFQISVLGLGVDFILQEKEQE